MHQPRALNCRFHFIIKVVPELDTEGITLEDIISRTNITARRSSKTGWLQFAVIKKMADVDFTTMLCEPELVMITARTVLFAYINLGDQ